MERAGQVMAGKGFYIVLLLCVGALGVSGYYLFSDMSEQGKTVSGPAQVVVTPPPRARLGSHPPASPHFGSDPGGDSGAPAYPGAPSLGTSYRHRLGLHLASEGRGPAGACGGDPGL